MINENAYHASISMLQNASTSKGFVAAISSIANYKRIWTRDGAICVIAALLSDNSELIETAKQTIITIFSNQHPNGFMPSNVKLESNEVSYGGTVGRVDNPSWAIIALCLYTNVTKDDSLKLRFSLNVEKSLALLDAWEFNGKHLVYMPQSGDWADEYIHHGYILFNQLLRVWCLKLAANVYKKNDYSNKADVIIKVIEQNFWKQTKQKYYTENLSHLMPKKESEYWLMGFNPSRVYTYFDLQANALALYLKIGTKKQQKMVIEWIKNYVKSLKISLIPSFYPTIQFKDADMKNLEHNYAYEFRNKPGQFHNGGIWNVWNGLLVLALNVHEEKKLATMITKSLHQTNSINNSFNECIDAKTLKPCGIDFCTWSAAGAIIAEKSFEKLI
ncbi:MAG: glycoside hydrolase 100 family protein [Chitinophagaceae bacterium]